MYQFEYKYIIEADGYKTFIDSFSVDTTNIDLFITLEEIIISPYGLKIQQLNDNADVLFSWNNSFDYSENFENVDFYLSSDTSIIILLDSIVNIEKFYNEIILFPNPTNSMLRVQTQKYNDQLIVIKSIIITDILGNILQQITDPFTVQYLDLTNYPSGVYVIKIETEKNKFTKKVIKN